MYISNSDCEVVMKRKIILTAVIAVCAFFIIDNIINYVMMRGVDNYYGLNQSSEILLIGHSHLMLSVDKERMEDSLGMKISKYCREGVNVTDRKTMAEHFLHNGHADSLKYVLYGVDLATFTGDGLSKNSYLLFYPFMDNEYVGDYVKLQTDAEDYWLHKIIKSTRFNDEGLKNAAIRGWMNNWDNFKNKVVDVNAYKKRLERGDERHIQMNAKLIAQFKETVELFTSRGVKVILVNTPTLYLLNQFEPEKYDEMIRWFQEYADSEELVEFMDYNPKYSEDYTIFSDRLHLNRKGQQIITDELIDYIKDIEK